MKLKAGDILEAKDRSAYYEILQFETKEKFKVKELEMGGSSFWTYLDIMEEHTDFPPLNNALNKKLYPNRVEYQGFLLPEKIAKELKNSCNLEKNV